MTPLNQRNRQLMRPAGDFASRGEQGEMSQSDSCFVLSPTGMDSEWRSQSSARQRRELQLSRTRVDLLNHVNDAIGSLAIDASVFSAAMQRCGQMRWWDTLLELRALQLGCGVNVGPIGVNILLKSLAQCVRGEYGFGPVRERQDVVVQLGREAWKECDQDIGRCSAVQKVMNLAAALHLCAAGTGPDASQWADALVAWAQEQRLQMNTICYTALALASAAHGRPERVDALLAEAARGAWAPNEVTLGALVNAAAERREWRRAEELWRKLVRERGVEPHELARAARAKAQLLCGRPAAAAAAAEEGLGGGGGPRTAPLAQLQVQALAVVCHSSLEPAALERLREAVRGGEPSMAQASKHTQRTWSSLKRVAGLLATEPAALRLHGVLVAWEASTSAMAEWPDYEGGSGYLARHECE